jgi:hypothetical protein
MDASKFNYRGTVYDGKFLLVVCFVVLWEYTVLTPDCL